MDQEPTSKTGPAAESGLSQWSPVEPAAADPAEIGNGAPPFAEPAADAPGARAEPDGFPPLAPVGEVAPEPAAATAEEAEPQPEPGPNWMLAFVCAWAGAFSLYQAWDIWRRADLSALMRLYALSGYTTLGVGLAVCTAEALLWGRLRRRAGSTILLLVLPLLLILAGVVCLFLFNDPDPGRSKI